jgi:tripartite-type tricarboxylate transporter receptor subunit TctC
VPFAAGSATDLVARGLGAKLQEILKQPIIVDDKPGASGQLGASAVATAPADGYTLMMGTNTTNAANGALFKKLSYDPEKDFAPIARCVTGVNALVVNNDLPIKSVAELVDYAKKNPGKLNYSEASASQRLSGEMFNSLAGVKIERVPYKASPQALGDVASGQVQVMFPDLPQALTQIQAGRVRGIGVTGPQRTKVAPDLPAIAETVKGYSLVYWLAVFAPAATPRPVQKKLFDAIAEAMKDPATVQAMTQGRMEAAVMGLDDFATYVKAETKWWTEAIKAAGIEPE